MAETKIQVVPVGMNQTNCYIVSLPERDDCVVIDPGDEADRIVKACRRKRIATILLTHGHFDHIGAVAALKDDAELVIHEADAPMLADPIRNAGAFFGIEVTAPEATLLVHEGSEVQAAGLTFKVLHTPGHTPGSVCFELSDTLFTGDTVFLNGYGRTDLPGGSMDEMMKSLRRLQPMLKKKHILPGHGGHS